MEKIIDIVHEVFNDDIKKIEDKADNFFLYFVFLILFNLTGIFWSFLNRDYHIYLKYESLLIIAFIFGVAGIYFLITAFRERISNDYVIINIITDKEILLGLILMSIMPLISLFILIPLILACFFSNEKEVKEKLIQEERGEMELVRGQLKRIKERYINYFNNLSYSDVKEKIGKLKKGVVEDVYRFKLTEEGYKKLMLALEMIKEHKLEIYAPVETRISTVTQIYTIEEVGKYAECPYCGSNIRETFYELGGVVRCDKCGALHHKECFEYYGRKCGSSSCKLGNA